MHKLYLGIALTSFACLPFTADANNLFWLKLEGGVARTPEGVLATYSTSNKSPLVKFDSKWKVTGYAEPHRRNSTGRFFASLFNTNDTSRDTLYGGLGVMTGQYPDIPVHAEVLFSYYHRYIISYHGRGESGFPTTAKLSTKLERYSVFLNGYIDLYKTKSASNSWAFFIQGGVGGAGNNLENILVKDEKTALSPYTIVRDSDKSLNTKNFAWNFGTGVNMYLENKYSLGIGYRYVRFGDVQSGQVAYKDNLSVVPVLKVPFKIRTSTHLFYISLGLF